MYRHIHFAGLFSPEITIDLFVSVFVRIFCLFTGGIRFFALLYCTVTAFLYHLSHKHIPYMKCLIEPPEAPIDNHVSPHWVMLSHLYFIRKGKRTFGIDSADESLYWTAIVITCRSHFLGVESPL